ncbi:MAG: TRAP transporter small permease subunit [Pseudomonadota bacterium]
MLKALDATATALSRAGLWISAALLVYIAGHVTLEIVMRTVFATSTFSMDEFVGYAVGAMTFLALGETFRNHKHIRVSILASFVKGRAALGVELLCIALTFVIGLFLARYIWRIVARDWSRGTVSPTLMETPMWIPSGLLFLGLCIFLLQLVASAAKVATEGVPDAAPSDA